MERLDNPVKDYAWGDRHRLQDFLGLPTDGSPAAELWVGTHPGGPSHLSDGRRLCAIVELPFLLKVLAAAEPLSLQVHPDLGSARRGFDEEEAAGLPLDDPRRRFKDQLHKPELFVALDTSLLLAGFRPVAQTLAMLRSVEAGLARDVVGRLETGGTDALSELFAELLVSRPAGADELMTVLRQLTGREPPGATGLGASARVAVDLAERYPHDQGWLVSLLLNLVTLRPGQAVFVGPGVLHAHLRGFGIEAMAASDNVLRAGMTVKHRDVRLVRELTRVEPSPPTWVDPRAVGPGLTLLETPATEFALLLVDAGGTTDEVPVPAGGPRLVLATEPGVLVRAERDQVVLSRGESVYVDPSEGVVRVSGPGCAVVVVVPEELYDRSSASQAS